MNLATVLLCAALTIRVDAAEVKLTVKVLDAVTLSGIPSARVLVVQTTIPAEGRPFIADLSTDGGGARVFDAPATSRLRITEINATGYSRLTASALLVTSTEPPIGDIQTDEDGIHFRPHYRHRFR